jgi:hypothetical protein
MAVVSGVSSGQRGALDVAVVLIALRAASGRREGRPGAAVAAVVRLRLIACAERPRSNFYFRSSGVTLHARRLPDGDQNAMDQTYEEDGLSGRSLAGWTASGDASERGEVRGLAPQLDAHGSCAVLMEPRSAPCCIGRHTSGSIVGQPSVDRGRCEYRPAAPSFAAPPARAYRRARHSADRWSYANAFLAVGLAAAVRRIRRRSPGARELQLRALRPDDWRSFSGFRGLLARS